MNQLKTRAIKLRIAGYSYSIIREKTGISKSTLSNWLAFIPFKPNKEVIEKIGRAKLKSALYKQDLKFKNIKNFTIAIHAYPDTNLIKSIDFWSKYTKIPKEQFSKIIIDSRKNKSLFNKRKLPYGTVSLRVKNGGTILPGVKGCHRKIMGWIESSTKQI